MVGVYLNGIFTQVAARIQERRTVVLDIVTEVADGDEVRPVELQFCVFAQD